MPSDDGNLYMIRNASSDGDDEWVSPEPADVVVTDAVVAASDLEADDLDDLTSYVDHAALAAVLAGEDDELSFSVEGHDVLVTSDGTVDVTSE